MTRTSTRRAETVIEKAAPAPVVSLASTAEVETSSASTTAPDTGDPPRSRCLKRCWHRRPEPSQKAQEERQNGKRPVRTAERRPRSGLWTGFPTSSGDRNDVRTAARLPRMPGEKQLRQTDYPKFGIALRFFPDWPQPRQTVSQAGPSSQLKSTHAYAMIVSAGFRHGK